MARGTKSIPSLARMLQDLTVPSARTRRQAAEILVERYPVQAIEPLIQMLTADPAAVNRQTAAELLSRMDDPALVPAFVLSLADRNVRVRLQAAQFLSRQGDARAVEPLLALLTHKEDVIRARSLRALQPFDDPRVVSALYARLDDPDDSVCLAAVQALEQRSEAEVAERLFRCLVEQGNRPPREQDDLITHDLFVSLINALDRMSTANMRQHLVEIVGNQNLRVRLRGCAALILAGHGDVAEALLDLLIDPGSDHEARRFAAYVLGSLEESRAVQPLMALLQDPEANVRGAVAEALGKIGDPLAVEALIELLADQTLYQEVQETMLGKPILGKQHPPVQLAVARALGQIGDGRAIEPLWATFGQGLMYHSEPLLALARLGDQRAYEPLLFRLRHANLSILEVRELTQALVRLAGHEAVEPLDQLLCDPSLNSWRRTACIDALVQLWITQQDALALSHLQWFASRQEETPERAYAREALARSAPFPGHGKGS